MRSRRDRAAGHRSLAVLLPALVLPALVLVAGAALLLGRRAVRPERQAVSEAARAEARRSEGWRGRAGRTQGERRAPSDRHEDVPHLEFHYAGMEHQADAALAGMWLFLATEVLFFGGLILLYVIYRQFHPTGTAEASRHAELLIGTVNTALLITSSAVFAYGFGRARRGDNRRLLVACVVTALIGLTFLALKGWEWKKDFDEHLFPGPDFAIKGADSGGAQLFYCFYFVATGLHGLHMIVGIGLVGWVGWKAWKRTYTPDYTTPVEAVGLYWGFVDMVWLVLYPVIYLAGRVAS